MVIMTKAPGELTDSLKRYVFSSYVARTYDSFFKDSALFRFDTRILDDLIPPNSRLLDIGCGTGRHVLHFTQKGCFVVGIDLSEHMLRICRRKLTSMGLDIGLARADMQRLTCLRDASFDYAICMFSTIGLIRGKHERQHFIEEVRRVLRPGGYFVLHTHNFYHSLFDPVDRFWPFRSALVALARRGELGDKHLSYYRGIRNMYLHVFRHSEVARLLRNGSFTIERTLYLNEPRNAELPHPFLRRLRANGFIFIARIA